MKKIYLFMLMLIVSFGLVACNKTPAPEPGPGEPDPEENLPPIDLGGDDFIIMVDKKNTTDPRSQDYEGLFRQQKIQAITNVEEKYNVNVKFENYPSNASWGGARERWIVEQSTGSKASAHVFQISSTSVGTLAVKNAILPLDDLIETYGVKGYWKEKLAFGQVFGKHYLYDDSYDYSDDGLYYNSDLIAELLGEEYRLEPTKKYLAGEWDWAAFEDLVQRLNNVADVNRPEPQGGPQYVLGGRTYNWVYPMLGANGTQIVDSNFASHLTSEPVLDVMNFLSRLRNNYSWIDNAPLSNASQPEFTAGNVVFHNGMSWHINASNKWGNANFDIDFVPYPKGPNIKEDGSNYGVTHVYGKPSYAISSAFSKADLDPDYVNLMIHEETIFRIWKDLQYFPEIDPATNQVSIEAYKTELYTTRLLPHYASTESINAHMKVFDLAKPDYFYSLEEAQSHDANKSYMLDIQGAIQDNVVREKMQQINSEIVALLTERYLNK